MCETVNFTFVCMNLPTNYCFVENNDEFVNNSLLKVIFTVDLFLGSEKKQKFV